MAGSKFVNTKCYICNHKVSYPAGYNSKTAKDHGNVEWIQTKRGLKQFFSYKLSLNYDSSSTN